MSRKVFPERPTAPSGATTYASSNIVKPDISEVVRAVKRLLRQALAADS